MKWWHPGAFALVMMLLGMLSNDWFIFWLAWGWAMIAGWKFFENVDEEAKRRKPSRPKEDDEWPPDFV